MIPSAFIGLTALPLTPMGKVDRAALPAPGRARPPLATPLIAPRPALEAALARLWAHALGLDEVGIHDDFLELGGHPLLATRILTRVTEVFGVDLRRDALFESSTVAAMSTVIDAHRIGVADPAALSRLLSDLETPSAG